MGTKAAALALVLALGGCAVAPSHSEYFDPPSAEERMERTLAASEKGPSLWSPAVTIPLYPILLVADTTIKFVGATYRAIRDLFAGSDDRPDVPERLERQAERIRKK